MVFETFGQSSSSTLCHFKHFSTNFFSNLKVRPCQDGLLWDPEYSICNRAQNIKQEVQCKLLQHKGSVTIEKLQAKKSKNKKKMAAMKKLGKKPKKFLSQKSIFEAKRPTPQRRPQPRAESRSTSSGNSQFKFFKPLF